MVGEVVEVLVERISGDVVGLVLGIGGLCLYICYGVGEGGQDGQLGQGWM